MEYDKLLSVYRDKKEIDAKKAEEMKVSKAVVKADKANSKGLAGGNKVKTILEECNELKNLNMNGNNDDETSKIG